MKQIVVAIGFILSATSAVAQAPTTGVGTLSAHNSSPDAGAPDVGSPGIPVPANGPAPVEDRAAAQPSSSADTASYPVCSRSANDKCVQSSAKRRPS